MIIDLTGDTSSTESDDGEIVFIDDACSTPTAAKIDVRPTGNTKSGWSCRARTPQSEHSRRHRTGPSGGVRKRTFENGPGNLSTESSAVNCVKQEIPSPMISKQACLRGIVCSENWTRSQSCSESWVPRIYHGRDHACFLHHEIYVSGLPHNTTAKGVIDHLLALFKRLPQFQQRYSNRMTPLIELRHGFAKQSSYFVFEFADEVLAATAARMTGVIMSGRSVRILPTHKPNSEEEVRELDVSHLRADGTLPWIFTPGQSMLNEVVVGGLTFNFTKTSSLVSREVTKVLLNMPAVTKKFPRMTNPVLQVTPSYKREFAMMELANEFLASTLVSLGCIQLSCCSLRLRWPSHYSDAVHRSPPSLCTKSFSFDAPLLRVKQEEED